MLGLCYLEGLGTAKNPIAARENLLEPADKGNQFAQHTLGIMLQSAEHLEKCPREKTATHLTSAAVASVPVVLAVTGTIALPVPTILVATVAFVAAEFGVPILTEKWRIPHLD